MLNDTTFIASAIDVSDIANAKDFPTEPQPSTSNAVSDYVHNDTSFNNYKEKIDDVDLFTLSDLGDSVADIPSELYDSSSSDDNVTLSTNWLRKYLKPQPKRQHKTEVLPDDNNPRPINTDEKSIQEENNSIFVADYLGPIFANKQDAQENYIKKSKCSLKRKSRHIMIINSCKSKCSRHTHMAADAVHANIEQKMRRQRGIYDFGDFKDCVLRSRKNIKILEIQNRCNWPKKKRAGRFGETLREFKLKFVVQVKFVKGSRNLFYKTRSDENFQEIEFLQKKINVNYFAPPVEEPWGVNQAKEDDIISKLVPLMPA
ncbi:unnamed protein product [Diatraea saccharalis]|uniref:Uncharacterized protein n=1 Tax=Diatraea saccharalis TaxID=40085 RepID=A0A9N9WCD4_9NEOP|nr:unnamed protein product [Diatraea saccharalis]